MLQWARANGCQWGTVTCAMAAKSGHVEVLQWSRANGCPWDAKTRSAAKGHVLEWAIANECPQYHSLETDEYRK